jgi:murein DD-endopeptidase MepM/ murein hydrolase activator NlpD
MSNQTTKSSSGGPVHHKQELLKRQSVKKYKLALSLPRKLGLFYLLSAGEVLFAVMMLTLFSTERTPELMIDGISLAVQQELIDNELMAYASPEMDARGSGDFSMADKALIRSVSTRSYTVKPGDTLSEIAALNGIDVGTLISFNEIEDVRRLLAGSVIRIPDIDGVPHVVRRGDSLESIAAKYNVTLEHILDANDLQTALIYPGQQLFIPGARINEYDYKKAMGTLFIYPVNGRLTSPFGYRSDPFTGVRRMHYGIDIANRVGTKIVAPMDGTVVVVGNQPNGYGRYVVIKHRYGFQTLYGHLSSIDVKRNQYISQGQIIGQLGNSGRSTGPHLHFSLYKNNIPIDPLAGYLYK